MELPKRQDKLCKNLLFLNFHCPKVQVNMPFISSKSSEKEQTNHNVYDETEMDEICSTDSHIFIRIQCWLDLYMLQSLHFWHKKLNKLISQN